MKQNTLECSVGHRGNKEIKNFPEIHYNTTATSQNLWEAVKAVL